VSYSGAGTGVTVDLSNSGPQATVGAGTDTISSTVEGVAGSPNVDTLTGNSSANSLTGGAGDDTLNGGDGDDTLNGGAGTGDTVSYSSAATGVTVTLASSSGQATGGSGTDTLSGFENLAGSAQDDILTGGAGVNSVLSGAGSDTITINDTSADTADCGSEADSVTADSSDTVSPNCESVTRTDGTPGGGDGGGGGGTPGGGTPGGGTAPAPPPPVLSGLAVPRLRSGKPGTISYSLDKAASVTLTIERVQAGRKAGSACRKQTLKNRKKRPCTLFVPVGKLSHAGVGGRNALRFSGKLAGRKLAAGLYRATGVATNAAGKSSPATAKFAVRR
jgi:hypothetical protein